MIRFRKAVLIIHGFTGNLYDNEYLMNYLEYERDFDVYAKTLPGHDKDRFSNAKYTDWLRFVDNEIDYLASIGYKTIYLVGHSMGGLVATAYTAKYPEKVDLLAVSGGATRCPKSANAIKFLPFNIMGKLNYVNKLGNAVCSVKEVGDDYNKDPLVLKKISFRLLGNAFVKGTKFVRKNIENIKCPTFVMHGEKDGVVGKDIGEWTFANLKCNDKTIKIYPNLYHEIFNEVTKDEVIEDLINWCEERMNK